MEKPHKFYKIQTLNRPKSFEKVTDDFDSRLKKQKVSNEHDSKLLEHMKRVNRFNRLLHFLNPRPSRDVNLSKYLSKSSLPHKKLVP